MNYKPLGKSNLQISEISFGCMSLGDDHQENSNLLHRALDNGINYFDTADIYQKGFNEVTVGKALANRRDKVIIATKVGNVWRPDGSGLDWNPTKAHILKSADESLQRLQTDYIDLYQLHGGTINDPIDETIEALEQLKEKGKIRYYGISSIRPNVIREYVRRSNIVSVMMQYSLLDRRPEETCMNLLHEHNIGLLTRGSLASGLLINKPAKPYLNYSEQEVIEATRVIKKVADGKRLNSEVALRFVLNHPSVISAVVGMHTFDQLDESLRVVKSPSLSPEEYRLLQHAIKINTYADHR
ncbi:MAG TPA: aldo/keto reductase [Cyclobacteriaceae bacterium]|jgi:aryl-alcohol dehydrogenase-like predicted oxidoreductase|nr:aldo/keto reductase [Cyclobacteriaceae bacterium]